jgi:hypothetical protein
VKNFLRSTLGRVLLTIVLVILPVIPVWSAPVIPNPTYELAWISLLQVVLIYWMVGVWYEMEWYSFVAFLGVVALIVLVWRGIRWKAGVRSDG